MFLQFGNGFFFFRLLKTDYNDGEEEIADEKEFVQRGKGSK